MANQIILKKSSVAGKVPLATDLQVGEIAVNLADKALYSKDAGGTVIQLGGGSGSGDVVGPSSATDNALARFDGTTGKLIQNSTATLSDTGNLDTASAKVDYLDLDTTASAPSYAQGRMYWDSGNLTPSIDLNADTTLQVGQESVALVYNGTGSTITNGSVVAVSGAQGQRPSVVLADADSESLSAPTLGIATQDIANGAEGFVTVFGFVRGIDTSAFTAGQPIYLSQTAGQFTATRPSAPAHTVTLGWVIKVNASSGEVFVNINNGWELDELHNVKITSVTGGQLLSYDQTNSYWKNTDLTAGTGISVSAATGGTITVTNSAPDQTVAISGTSPVSVSGTYPNFTVSMTQSSGSTNGWLSSTDWTTFNGKQTAYTNLSTIGALANGTGWLYNNGSGTFSYSTPTAADVGAVPTTRSLTINGTSYDLSADRTWSVGTVTSVAALTIDTTGTDITSTVATNTTTPVITLNVPTASATNRGALSSTDWSTFNSKAPATSGTSILYGNGSGGFSNVTVGTGLTFTGGTLASTGGSTPNIIYDQFTATAGQTTFTTSANYTSGKIQVYKNGAKLRNGTDVTVTSGNQIVFAVACTLNDLIDADYPSTADSTKMNYDQFVAIASQTTFTTSATYTSMKIDVYRNGAKMRNGTDVTVTSGSTIVFAVALTAGDYVDAVYPV